MIVRENHEDLYAGIEFEEGSAEAEKLRQTIAELSGRNPSRTRHLDQPISIYGTTRIVRAAFEYARRTTVAR